MTGPRTGFMPFFCVGFLFHLCLYGRKVLYRAVSFLFFFPFFPFLLSFFFPFLSYPSLLVLFSFRFVPLLTTAAKRVDKSTM